MDLATHYAAMRAAALPRLARGAAEFDPLLAAPEDDRRGLTLLTRPPAPILAGIETILADFRRSEPAQYYYPATDIHLTILSIISCYRGFSLAAIDQASYRAAVRRSLRDVRPFSIRFAGLTAAPGGLLVQGFPADDSLQELRDTLRRYFQQAGLPQTIDQRYRLQTAHATVMRFGAPLADPARLVAKIEQYQHQFIGTFQVDAIELVFNDWYQRAANTVLLEKFPLAGA